MGWLLCSTKIIATICSCTIYCCVADSGNSDNGENGQQLADDTDDDSARGSSDVTWCASEFELTTDMCANDFESDATNANDAEPFYDMDRQ